MDWLSAIWGWFIGLHPGTQVAVVAALIAGLGLLWAIDTHFSKRKSDSAVPTRRVTASGGGVSAGGDIKADVVQTGSGAVYYYGGVTEERFQALSEELGVRNAALQGFFKVLEGKVSAHQDAAVGFRAFD